MVIGEDPGDLAAVDVNAITSWVSIDEVANGISIPTFDHIEDIQFRTKEGFGILTHELQIRVPTFDFSEGARMDEILS